MYKFLENVWSVFADLSLWLFVGMFIAALLKVFIPDDFIKRHLGKAKAYNILKAVLIGVPMPLCSCSVIPTTIGIRKQGAGDDAAMAFLVSTPQTGVDSVMVSAGFLSWPFAIFKLISAFIIGLIAGFIVRLKNSSEDRSENTQSKVDSKPEPEIKTCCSPKVETEMKSCCAPKSEPEIKSCCSPKAEANKENPSCCSKSERSIHFLISYAFKDLLYPLWRWLLVGVLLSALISTFLSDGSLTQSLLGDPLFAPLIVLVISLPWYVCATASVPIAAAMVAAGMPPSAALVLLLAGPASNIATIGAVYKTFGRSSLIIYLSTIIICSVIFSYLFAFTIQTQTEIIGHHDHGGLLFHISAVIMLLSFAYFFYYDIQTKLKKRKKSICCD